MYATTIEQLTNPVLHDGAYILSLRGDQFKLRSIYMDSKGECAITYYGHLTIDQIKDAMIQYGFFDTDVMLEEINPEYGKDFIYEYSDDKPITHLYTPDGKDYRNYVAK